MLEIVVYKKGTHTYCTSLFLWQIFFAAINYAIVRSVNYGCLHFQLPSEIAFYFSDIFGCNQLG